MDPLYLALGLAFMAALWFLPVGIFRLIVYRSGQIDHTDGMHNVARTILTIGVVALVVSGILTAVVLTGA